MTSINLSAFNVIKNKKKYLGVLIGQNIVMSFLQTSITIKLKMREKEGEGVNIGNNLLTIHK